MTEVSQCATIPVTVQQQSAGEGVALGRGHPSEPFSCARCLGAGVEARGVCSHGCYMHRALHGERRRVGF